jgi:Fic-DOC domain mobile mystery protein B
MSSPGGRPQSFNVSTIGPEPPGATPIDDEDLSGLIPAYVATRADLNQVEYENIARALPWAQREVTHRRTHDVLNRGFLFTLHERMFGDVWKWAGTQRRKATNIGVDPGMISDQLAAALADGRYWHDNNAFSDEERAVRIHYRLVVIHPFSNGNGRCTRLLVDLYLTTLGVAPLTWGTAGAEVGTATRDRYIAALQEAPSDECRSLVAFACS